MKKPKFSVGLTMLAFLGACHTGPQVANMGVLRLPQGAAVEVQIEQEGRRQRLEHDGELIEVREDGVVLELQGPDGPYLAFATWDVVYRIKATELQGFQSTASASGARRAEGIEKMRLVSRFPQGLSPELFEQLLAGYGQQALDQVGN